MVIPPSCPPDATQFYSEWRANEINHLAASHATPSRLAK
jgi:hypothetical protein